MGSKDKARKTKNKSSIMVEQDEENSVTAQKKTTSTSKNIASEHAQQLRRLSLKDPEFYEFLKEHDKELLEFSDEDVDDEVNTGMNEGGMPDEENDGSIAGDVPTAAEKEDKTSKSVITTAMVDSWCTGIKEHARLNSVRSLMRAFRTACHYGDAEDESPAKLSIMSSSVFNKTMIFVLNEMDGVLRGLLKLPPSGVKSEAIMDLMDTKKWKSYNSLVKSYLGNALHVLNEMTDTSMISFTLERLRKSSIFLVAFPSLLRKYIKVALHFWGTGGGSLPIISLLFLRDLCIQLDSGCTDECFKGIYKAYVLNCQFVNAAKLPHIQLLGNCVIELFRVNLPAAYQHAFVFIRQLASILREALVSKTKEAFRRVYEWKYMYCLQLWTGAICVYSSESDFRPLAYPLTQIIFGVARLVPTARYFPLRLRCARMLNEIAASTGSFIPVSLLLLDVLEMKELNTPPTGGVGAAIDFRTVLKVKKHALKTRSFQEACVISVVEELSEHLAQWSYSVAFFELSFLPAVRLRNFCKLTKVERFRKEMRNLIRQIEANSAFTNQKRMSISFLPNEPAATSFLEDEKKSGSSPLSKYVATLRQRAQQRNESLTGSSILVGEHSSVFFGNKLPDEDEDHDTGNEKGAAVFSSSWLPGRDSKINRAGGGKEAKNKKKRGQKEMQDVEAIGEDVVEDLVLSSDEEDITEDTLPSDEDGEAELVPQPKKPNKKRKQNAELSKGKALVSVKKSKKRRRANQ